jgi:hypothetical protein
MSEMHSKRDRYPHGRVFQRNGVWIAYYYERPRARHQERAVTKDTAEKILKRRLTQIRAGKFRPSLPLEERGTKISNRWTAERRGAQKNRMKEKNRDEGFRALALEGIEKANTPELIEIRRKTLKNTLSLPSVRRRQLAQLRKATRSPRANASRSAVARSLHAQAGLNCEQVLSLLGCAKRDKDRDWVMLLLTFWHRLRPDQTVRLTADDLTNGSIAIPGTEPRAAEPLISHSEPVLNEREAVGSWLASQGAIRSGLLFPTVSRKRVHRLIHAYARAAGLPETLSHVHVLRNSLEAREKFRTGTAVAQVPGGAALRAEPAKKKHERGPDPTRFHLTVKFAVGEKVEKRLALFPVRSRSAVSAARQAVAAEHAVEPETVKEYHLAHLKWLKSQAARPEDERG